MKISGNLKFKPVGDMSFSTELRKRVNNYFKEKNVSVYGNWRVYHKTVVWLVLYLTPLVIILTGIPGIWGSLLLVLLMGISMCGIGLNVMHDANHGNYSSKGWVNNLAGASLTLMGGNPLNWRIQHNVLHHTFTNVLHKDEDVGPRYVLKFSPSDKTRWFHRYQHIYAPFFYALMTLIWAFSKDFTQLQRYHKLGLVKQQRTSYRAELWRTIAIKVFYFGYILVLPMLVTDLLWWQWLIGFLTMHFTAGLLLALVFQSAHVVEQTEHPVPDTNLAMEDEWMVHQLRTTANFATKNKWFSWFAGGLNFQIEHHLFPNISHIHYPAISEIVKQCAHDFNLPYHDAPTFTAAVRSHFKTLKELGRAE
jgi:linoleoyl-CoA desaturase